MTRPILHRSPRHPSLAAGRWRHGHQLFPDGPRQSGDAPEMWNFDHPERVRSLHRRFIEAGADIVLTNTFGGNRHRLKLHNAQDQVREINIAAAQERPCRGRCGGPPGLCRRLRRPHGRDHGARKNI